MIDSTLIFVDGENLAIRYKEMISSGRVPRPDNIYIEDVFIWNQRVLNDHTWKIKRLAYYTSVCGDSDRVVEVREKISKVTFTCEMDRTSAGSTYRSGQIVPFVRKRRSKSKKESICDIALSVDIMRACYRDHAESMWIFTGDGDFVQLFMEAVHSGKCVYASSFSSGMSKEIPLVVDEFLPLDKHFFLSEDEIAEAEDNASVTPSLANCKIGEGDS